MATCYIYPSLSSPSPFPSSTPYKHNHLPLLPPDGLRRLLVLARRAPGHRRLPVEPDPPVVLHLALPPRLPRLLRRALPRPRRLPRRRPPPPEAAPAGPRALGARAAHGRRVRGHLRRDAAVGGGRDTGHAVVVARAQPHHALPVAPLLPAGDALLGPRLLLVLRLLPLPLPPRGAGRLRGAAPPPPGRGGAGLRARGVRRHGLPLARVLAVVPAARHPRLHAGARRRLRLPLLGRRRTPRRPRRARRARVPARAARVQPRMPRRRRVDALRRRRRRVQRHRRLGLQHAAQRSPALGLPPLLRQARRLRRRRRRQQGALISQVNNFLSS